MGKQVTTGSFYNASRAGQVTEAGAVYLLIEWRCFTKTFPRVALLFLPDIFDRLREP